MNKRRSALTILVVSGVAVVIGLAIWLGYSYAGTGFGDYIRVTPQGEEVVRGKTLWDWLDLLIVPLTLAAGGAGFTYYQRKRDIELAERSAQEAALQTYLDQMTELMLAKGLVSDPKPGTSNIARIWTLTTLRRVDGDRKGVIVEFLQEAGLVKKGTPLVSLANADLQNANFRNKSLRGVDFGGGYSVGEHTIKGAYLNGADLRRAKLNGANLASVNLCGANLYGAELGKANLAKAKYDKKTIWPESIKDPKAWGAEPID